MSPPAPDAELRPDADGAPGPEGRAAPALPDEQFRTLADSIPQLAWMADAAGWIFWYNRRWYDFTGAAPAEMEGWGWTGVHHPDHVERVVERFRASVEAGEPWEDTFPLRSRTGEYRWFLSRALPIRDAEGRVARWFGTNTDVTEQMRAEERERALIREQAAREAAEDARRRERLMAEAGRVLVGPMDEEARLCEVARLLVPEVADWCVVDLLRDDGRVERVEIVAADPRKAALIELMLARHPHVTSAPGHPVGEVLRTGGSRFFPHLSPHELARFATSDDHRSLLLELSPVSSMMVPLAAGGQVLGALTLSTSESGRHFGETDLALAEELGRRVALAVQNARLYRAAQRSRGRVARLQEVTAALSEAVTPEAVAEVVVRQGAAAVGAAGAGVAMLSDDGTTLELLAVTGFPPGTRERWSTFPVTAAVPMADAVLRGEPVAVAGEEELRRRYPAMDTALAPVHRAWAAVPLLLEGCTIGSLGLAFTRPVPPSEADRQLLLAIARQAALALERARLYERERRAVRARDEVLGVVAHDLRNPLGAIAMLAHLVEEESERGDRRGTEGFGQKIVDLAEQANRLIQDLLDVSRIEAGRLRVEPLPVPAQALLARVADLMGATAARGGVELHVDGVEHGLLAWADLDRVTQVLSNLVGNALKFTPRGGRVSVGVEPRGAEVAFTVADTGAGIAPEHLPHVFDRFWQARSATRAGAGLGLAIARGIVEAHGGEIQVWSRPGEGTVFTFTLPRARAAVDFADAPTPAPPAEHGGPAPLRVLVADDHPALRRGVVEILRRSGWVEVVGEAATGEEALERARDLRPDVVLMDLAMPGMGGVEATRRLREADPGVRVVALTAEAADGPARAVLRAGGSGVVHKAEAHRDLLPALTALARPESAGEEPPG